MSSDKDVVWHNGILLKAKGQVGTDKKDYESVKSQYVWIVQMSFSFDLLINLSAFTLPSAFIEPCLALTSFIMFSLPVMHVDSQ